MNNKLHSLYIISNIIFYIGIITIIYLYVIDDNTAKWLGAEVLVIFGILGSSISDMMINVGISGISLNLVRYTLLIKYIVFCIVVTLLDNYFKPIFIISMILFVLDFTFEYILIKQIKGTSTSIETFIEKVKQYDTLAVDRVIKYIAINTIGVLILANTYENIFGFIIAAIICIIIHLYTSEKIVTYIHDKKLWKIRFVLWSIEILTIVFGFLNYRIITCSLFGLYYMVITDLLIPKKTSIISKKS